MAQHKAEILIADDDPAIRMVMSEAFSQEGWQVIEAVDAAELKEFVRAGKGDVVVTDVLMPGGNGLDALEELVIEFPVLPFIVVSAQNTLTTAMEASKKGAYDYVPKPFDINELCNIVKSAIEHVQKENVKFHSVDDSPEVKLIGRSQAMQSVYRIMARVVETDLTVLIEGQSGTGKELIAREIHQNSKRKTAPFIAINMAAVPKELIESELFGHEKGAFTGAAQKSIGRFGQAKGGTLFLDEIGDMPLEAQTRLLRVLQEGEYHTVGGQNLVKTDVRIIAATNKDLHELVRQGLFREDLYYRLNVVPIRVPSLAERVGDIADLIEFFNRSNKNIGLDYKNYHPAALSLLERYRWPGNVRELENLIRRLAVLYAEDEIVPSMILDHLTIQADPSSEAGGHQSSTADHLVHEADSFMGAVRQHLDHFFDLHAGSTVPIKGVYHTIIQEVETPLIEKVLEYTGGNQLKAANILGLNRNTLRKKIKELHIKITK